MDRTTDLVMDQRRQGYFHAESCIHFRGINILQPNITRVVTASWHTTNIDSHCLLDAYDNVMMHGVTQYTGIQHQHDLDVDFPAAPNLHYSGRNPSSSTGALPLPRNHRASDQLSRSVAPPNARHTDGVDVMAPNPPNPSLLQVGPHGRSWSRSTPNVNGSSLENASLGFQRYHFASSNRGGLRFPHPPAANSQHHHFHHRTLPMQGMRSDSIIYLPTVTTPSYRVQTNPSRSVTIHTQAGFEVGARHVGPVPPTGLRMHQPNREGMPETTLGHQNFPPMGFIQVDDVALLVDRHRDMQLDTEDMFYEELLALGQRIGNVSTGLSEEMITTQMKTKTYLIPATAINLKEATSEELEADTCIICQDEYKNQEKIGILQCGHEYHADCLRKWLLVKNVCPMCKSEALTPGRKGDENQ